jgi:tetratricopeptide (TPR) repeat protein
MEFDRERAASHTIAALLCVLSSVVAAQAQDAAEPRVARVQLQLKSGEKTIDVIEPGDLLTVLDEDDQSYTVLTYLGRRGQVSKANAVKLAEAVKIYDQLIAKSPQSGQLYTQRAMARWARGDQQRALADFNRAIELGYKAAHAFSSRGIFHAAVGNVDAALADFARAIEIDPRDEVSYINRAAIHMSQSEFDRALADYSAAVRLGPAKAGNYQQRAAAHQRSGNLSDALADYNKALELDPKHVPSLMGRGFALYEQGKYAQAVDDYSAAIALAPNSATAYNNRGFNRQLLGDHESALADFERALHLMPDYALCLQNKAWLLATSPDDSLRNGVVAVRAALRACELNQYKDLNDLRTLAASYAEAGQFELAIGWQEKVIEQSPGDEKAEARKVLERYKSKQPYRDNGTPD